MALNTILKMSFDLKMFLTKPLYHSFDCQPDIFQSIAIIKIYI